jgi:hypothetical protein
VTRTMRDRNAERRQLFRLTGGASVAVLAAILLPRTAKSALPGRDRAPSITIGMPGLADAQDPIPIAIRIERSEAGAPIDVIELVAEGRPFPGLGRYVPPAGERRIALDWHIRVDCSETLGIVVRTSDGAIYRAHHNIIVC